MKYLKNDMASVYYSEESFASIEKIFSLIRKYPFVFEPFRGINEEVEGLFSSHGFSLYPTVKKTTLFYDQVTDCFFKILQPLTHKRRVCSLLKDRAKSIYRLSEYLLSKGVRVPTIVAYGLFKSGRKPFYGAKRIEGKSLYDILIRDKRELPEGVYVKVMDEVTRLHRLGYWLGDAHLSHIFVNDSEVSGFIDIDGLRKTVPFSVRCFAKDIAALNHPNLPLEKDEKRKLLKYYVEKVGIKNKDHFMYMVKRYSKRRWKSL